MEELTDRQKQILSFIVRESEDRGFPPTIREIQHHFRLKSTKGVKVHLDILMKKGYIIKSNKARDIDIVGWPRMKVCPSMTGSTRCMSTSRIAAR